MSKTIKLGKKDLLRRTIPYIKKEKKLFIITIILTIIISLSSATTPFITKKIIDTYLLNQEYKNIVYALILYLFVTIILAVSRYFFQYINTLTGMKIEKRIREEAMNKINLLPVDYYSLEPDGKIVAKITSDTAGVRTFYTTMFQIINAIINIIVVYVGVIIMEPVLGLLVLLIVPIIILWVTLYRRKVHRYFVDLRETGSKITGKLNELITGTLIIQDFNQEEEMLSDYEGLAYRYVKNDRLANTINIYFGWELLSFIKRIAEISLLMFLGFSSISVSGVVVSVGLISAFSDNLDKMINPINAIFNNLNELEDSLVGASRAYGFIDEKNDTKTSDGITCPSFKNGDVEFKHIWFSYVDNKYVLKDVSLKVDAGKTIGIVGQTGSGKSSLMNLLLRYNDYQKGELLIDGYNIKDFNKQSYRDNMGIVLQTPALFQGTLKSNVTMERDYSDDEVIDVLKSVGADYLIDRTSDGINMPISFRGENLSLGEKQLISFARILLRNPKILVLDEATANIDSETEEKIQKAMDVVSKNRTTFVIAHRLSTIKNADQIIVLHDGMLVGVGSHESLYQDCSYYKIMYDSQFNNK